MSKVCCQVWRYYQRSAIRKVCVVRSLHEGKKCGVRGLLSGSSVVSGFCCQKRVCCQGFLVWSSAVWRVCCQLSDIRRRMVSGFCCQEMCCVASLLSGKSVVSGVCWQEKCGVKARYWRVNCQVISVMLSTKSWVCCQQKYSVWSLLSGRRAVSGVCCQKDDIRMRWCQGWCVRRKCVVRVYCQKVIFFE